MKLDLVLVGLLAPLVLVECLIPVVVVVVVVVVQMMKSHLVLKLHQVAEQDGGITRELPGLGQGRYRSPLLRRRHDNRASSIDAIDGADLARCRRTSSSCSTL